MLSLSRRSAIIAAVLLSGTVASMLSSIVSADDATYSIRMEFCQN